MNKNRLLTEQEAAYVRRFCYEVATNYKNFGLGSIFAYCQEHSLDLEVLATVTAIQGEFLEEVQTGRAVPPEVPFPWGSFEELHRRAEEARIAFPEKY